MDKKWKAQDRFIMRTQSVINFTQRLSRLHWNCIFPTLRETSDLVKTRIYLNSKVIRWLYFISFHCIIKLHYGAVTVCLLFSFYLETRNVLDIHLGCLTENYSFTTREGTFIFWTRAPEPGLSHQFCKLGPWQPTALELLWKDTMRNLCFISKYRKYTYSGVLKYFFSAVENDLLVSNSFLLARSSSALCWSGSAGPSLPAASSNSFISDATSLKRM